MEVFAEARRDGLLEELATRRFLKAAQQANDLEPVPGGRRRGAIGRRLAWLAHLVRPDRPAAAS
jgi:hypothetical protein